jgi:hypothetical protein
MIAHKTTPALPIKMSLNNPKISRPRNEAERAVIQTAERAQDVHAAAIRALALWHPAL